MFVWFLAGEEVSKYNCKLDCLALLNSDCLKFEYTLEFPNTTQKNSSVAVKLIIFCDSFSLIILELAQGYLQLLLLAYT